MRSSRNTHGKSRRENSKILLIAFLLVSGFAALLLTAPVPSRVHAASTGLVASYSFNEGSGSTVNDSSGNGNNGTVSGATWTTAGKYGGALSFNGRSARVIVNDSASLHLSSGMTLEAWVSPTSAPRSWEDVIFKQNDIYFLEAGSSGSNNPPAVGATFAAHGDQYVTGSAALSANAWTHLAATYNGSTLLLYVNGIQVVSRTLSDSLTSSTNALQIGGDALYGQYFKGTIDEVRVYNRALAPAEIQNDMATPISQTVADTQPPTAPSNLSGTASGPTSINLGWTASTDNVGVTGYLLERCMGSGCTSFSQIAAPTGTSYSDTGLTASTSYSYRVRATDAAGNLSAYSNTSTVVTSAATTSGYATIGFVQANYATPQSSQVSVSIPYSAAQIAGDLNVVVVGWNNTSASVSSVTDSSGNAYTLAIGPTQVSGAITQSIFYAKNILAAAAKSNAVNVAFSGPAAAPDIRILEYAGLDPVNPFDVSAAGTGSSSSSASPSVATTNTNDLIFGANIVVSLTTGPGSGFTQRILTSPDGDIAEDKSVSSIGSYSASAPLGSSASWIMQMVAFKAALLGSTSGSESTPPAPTLVSIAIAPSSATISSGATQSFAATGTLSNNTTENLTSLVTWNSSNTSVATIGANTGLATGVSAGTSQISASLSGIVSTSVTLTVNSSGGGGGGGSAAAALVQHVSSSNTRNNSFSSPYCYNFQLPNYTTAGNAVVVGFTFNGNSTPAVSDDKGNSYSVQVNYYDSADTQSIGIATAFNVSAGARLISVCFSSNPGGYVQPMATEFDNVVGIDTTSASQGSGTAVSAGNLTPSVSGDLAYQVAFSLSVNQSSFASGSQSNISWNLLSADLMDGWAAQYGLYNSTSSLNPTLSMGSSQKWLSAAVLLKTGSTGGAPSGMHIVRLVHENIPEHTAAGGTGNPFANPTSLQFPSSGNLLVAMIGGGYLEGTVTSMTDTNGNAWAQAGATQIQAGNDAVQCYYAGNANSSGSLALTVHWTATDGDFTILFYDVAGAAAAPLDTTAGGTGVQSVAGNLTVPFTISPAGAGELVFTEIIWDYNTGSGLVGSGWLFDTNTFSGESQSGPEPIDQNNGWGHTTTTGTNTLSITWQTMYPGLPTGNWASLAAAFKPAQ